MTDDYDEPGANDRAETSDPSAESSLTTGSISEALGPLEDEVKRLFDVSLDLLCVAHPDGYFLQVNPAFERVLGYEEDELTSRPIVDFVHPDDRDATQAALEQLGNDENVTGFTNRYICRDGSIVWLEWQSRAYQEGGRIYASARNITDLRRAKRERDQLESKFQQAQKLESVALLAGGIAHDFNNLLTTILGNTGLILMELEDSEPLTDRAKAIRRSASTAADLCEQLLAYAGEGQFDVRPTDVSTLVEATDHLLDAAVSPSAELQYALQENLPAAELDATQVRQILMNVVKNASEALPDGRGVIRIETGVRECSRSELAEAYLDDNLTDGTYVYLEVADSGCGMTDHEIRRIFDPFYTTKFAGRGLGLAATLGIVRAHEGTVTVESEPGDGTRFRFYFPALETGQPFSSDETDLTAPKIDAETILIADDNRDIRNFVESTLRWENLGVLKAVDGRDAVEAFRHHHEEISVVILDVTMPGLDCSKALEEIRSIDDKTPVVLSSGYSESSTADDLGDEEIAGFLQKPYGPRALLRTLSEVLRKQASGES